VTTDRVHGPSILPIESSIDNLLSDYLAEVTRAGQTVWQWRTWEHLDPVADGIAEVQAPRTLWAQGNSVHELPDGDILASYRPTSTVIRISRQTGKILWKLGPPTVAGQHAPTLLENGNILIFDNGPHRLDDSVPYSRVTLIHFLASPFLAARQPLRATRSSGRSVTVQRRSPALDEILRNGLRAKEV
jgi:hypothetical protein